MFFSISIHIRGICITLWSVSVCMWIYAVMAGDWLMAEQILVSPWLSQIGTAETWHWNSLETHTHTSTEQTYTYLSVIYTKITGFVGQGVVTTCPPHLLKDWICQEMLKCNNGAVHIWDIDGPCILAVLTFNLSKGCKQITFFFFFKYNKINFSSMAYHCSILCQIWISCFFSIIEMRC